MHQRHNQEYGGLPPDEAALHWIARRMSGAMNAEERRDFESWLMAAPANKAAFADAEALLRRADIAGEELLACDFAEQLHAQASRRANSQLRLASLAATMAIIALGAVITLFASDFRPRAPLAYETMVGQSEAVALADGSRIELNTASRVEVDFSRSSRSIELAAGEVFFNVEKDSARPFIVATKHADIAVTGTSFSIATFEDRSSVHVLTGVVEVSPRNGAQATLLAGDTIEIGADGRSGGVKRYDASIVFAWRNGKARFKEEPLGDVIMSLNRYFETPIVLADQSLTDLPVTGEFDIRDRGMAIDALKLIFDLASADEPARTILKRPDAE